EVITGVAAKLSLADACSCAGRAATRAAAPPAARVAGPAAGAGAGAACAVPVAAAADTAIVTAATAPKVMARLTAVLPSRERARPFGRARGMRWRKCGRPTDAREAAVRVTICGYVITWSWYFPTGIVRYESRSRGVSLPGHSPARQSASIRR